jgi:imidazoleglycerol-phosphate dehydratase
MSQHIVAQPAVHRIRRAEIERETLETKIALSLGIDGHGAVSAQTGVPFLDHMIDALCRHARFDLTVTCTGDAAMDPHHTVEDVGIVFGQAIRQSIGDRAGIARFGHGYAPLDESLARVVVDCSGRPFLHFEAAFPEELVAPGFVASLVEEFWRGVVINAGLTVHIDLLRCRNSHHAAEAIFKAAAVAFREAFRLSGDPTRVPSTKGVLA